MKAIDFKTVVAMRRHLREENQKYPPDGNFVDLPRESWPARLIPRGLIGVKRSREFLVQIYQEADRMIRLSINRTSIDAVGEYQAGIRWEELQEVKSRCGFGVFDAVEAYPPDGQVVNRTNMRHLWVFPVGHELPFFWRTKAGSRLSLGQASEEILKL